MTKQIIRHSVKPIDEQISTGSVESVLAGMFRKILHDIGVTNHRFSYLMERFLVDNRNKIPQNVKEKSSARGNLRKELLKSSMTWKVFCKGLRFLNITKFEVTVRLHHTNKQTTEHTQMVVFGDQLSDEMVAELMNPEQEKPNDKLE